MTSAQTPATPAPTDASSFALLDFAPKGSWLEHDETAPMPFAVWSPEGDILGAGECASEAIEEARATVRVWESNRAERAEMAANEAYYGGDGPPGCYGPDDTRGGA